MPKYVRSLQGFAFVFLSHTVAVVFTGLEFRGLRFIRVFLSFAIVLQEAVVVELLLFFMNTTTLVKERSTPESSTVVYSLLVVGRLVVLLANSSSFGEALVGAQQQSY